MSQPRFKPATPKHNLRAPFLYIYWLANNVIYEHNTVSDLTNTPDLYKICLEAKKQLNSKYILHCTPYEPRLEKQLITHHTKHITATWYHSDI
jgi:hypothetical protein